MGAAGPAVGMQAVGAGFSAYAAYQQGVAQQNYYNYLAGNARTESALVKRQAGQEEQLITNESLFQQRGLERKTSEIEGAQSAAAGANVGGGSGTTVDIARDTFNKAHLDSLAIKYNADVQSWRTQNSAQLKEWQLGNEAAGYEIAGKEAKRAGKINAISSLLGGAGQVSGTYLTNAPYASAGKTA